MGTFVICLYDINGQRVCYFYRGIAYRFALESLDNTIQTTRYMTHRNTREAELEHKSGLGLKLIPNGPTDNKSALVKVIIWRPAGLEDLGQ